MTKGALKGIFSRNRGAVKTQKTTVGDTVARLWFLLFLYALHELQPLSTTLS